MPRVQAYQTKENKTKCQNWKKINCFQLLNISAPLDGIGGSKAVNKTLLEILTKTGEAKSEKELEFFQHHGF